MTVFVPIMLYGWIPFTIILFFVFPPQKAILISIIGGNLFLPMASFDIPGIPVFNKVTTISIGLIISEILTYGKNKYRFKITKSDIPMIIWCFFSPLITSLSNNLGFYDGLSSILQNYLGWGIFYWVGRKYFTELESLNLISKSIIIGGLIYVPLILFELRMSPQLSNIFYGFFPHSWSQHVRYGSYRPIVFMKHGLMVARWMAVSFTVALWLKQNKKVKNIVGIPINVIVITLFVIAVLCKSANAWFFLVLGIISSFYYKKFKSARIFLLLLSFIPLYIIVRVTNTISLENVQSFASNFFDPDRIYSLSIRLNQENLFNLKAFERFFFGWGGWGRGWPIDPRTGEQIRVVDSLWIIIFSSYGFIGLSSLFIAMLLGPWTIFRMKYKQTKNYMLKFVDAITLSIIIIFFLVDSLLNGMVNPLYILCAGTLVSISIKRQSIEKHGLKEQSIINV